MFKKNRFIFILILLFGLIIGSFVDVVLTNLLPDGVVKDVLTLSAEPGINLENIDLKAIIFSFKIGIRVNLCSIFGLGIAAYIFKWY